MNETISIDEFAELLYLDGWTHEQSDGNQHFQESSTDGPMITFGDRSVTSTLIRNGKTIEVTYTENYSCDSRCSDSLDADPGDFFVDGIDIIDEVGNPVTNFKCTKNDLMDCDDDLFPSNFYAISYADLFYDDADDGLSDLPDV